MQVFAERIVKTFKRMKGRCGVNIGCQKLSAEGDKPIVWKSDTEYLQTMGRHVSNVSIEEYGGARPKVKHPADGKKPNKLYIFSFDDIVTTTNLLFNINLLKLVLL